MKNVNVKLSGGLNTIEEEVLNQFKIFQQAIIDQDERKLNELMHNDFVLIHMSGKSESKEEFIKDILDKTLNYYESTINYPKITVEGNDAQLFADITLDAKVYGMKGVWTLHSTIFLEKVNQSWLVLKWDN